MLPEIELDVLQCLDRAVLERLQMHSRYLRDLVSRHARSLPLRYIHDVEVVFGGVYIQLVEGDRWDDWVKVEAPDEQELETLFHRANNAYIRRLTLSFLLKDLPLPYYLRGNVSELQCQIGALRIEQPEGEVEEEHARAVGIDYALVDFLGVHLKPHIYETMASFYASEDYAMLFTHDALYGNVTDLVFKLQEDPAPVCLIPELFGVDVVETCSITTEFDPRPWIRKFIEMFEMAERGTDIVRSVTLLHLRIDEPALRLDVEPLGQPHRANVLTPQSDFLKEWSEELVCQKKSATQSTVADVFEFENAKLAKKLELFVWTVEQGYNSEGTYCLQDLNYAFLLQVIDM